MYLLTDISVLNRHAEKVLDRISLLDVEIISAPDVDDIRSRDDVTRQYGLSRLCILYHIDDLTRVLDELIILVAQDMIDLFEIRTNGVIRNIMYRG